MEFAIVFRIVVLPALGCATIIPRWPLPIGTDQIHDTPGHFIARRLQRQSLIRIDRRQIVKVDAIARDFRIHAIDRFHPQQAKILFRLFRRPNLSGDLIAGLQPKPLDLRLGDIDIFGVAAKNCCAEEIPTRPAELQEFPLQ